MPICFDRSPSAGEYASHRFLREPLRERKTFQRLVAASVSLALFLLLTIVLSIQQNGLLSLTGHTMAPSLIGVALFLPVLWRQYRPQKIIIDHNGIAFAGTFGFHVPPLLAWRDITLIRCTRTVKMENLLQEKLVFVTRYGDTFFFPFRRNGQELFHADRDDTTLCGIVERHWRPVELLRSEEKQRIPQLRFSEDTDARTERLVFAALAALCAAALLNGLTPTYALTTSARLSWLCTGTLAGALLAFLYTRPLTNRLHRTFSTLLVAAVSAWIMLPVTATLRRWFGEKRGETFVLVREDNVKQIWSSSSTPELRLKIRSRGRQWRYQQPGTHKELMLYHGPLGLYALSRRGDDLFRY